jgi:hypothetical protein
MGQTSKRRFVVKQSQPKLANVVAAGHTPGCFPSRLNRRQKQSDENSNDGYDHQQFHQRKRCSNSFLHDRNLTTGRREEKGGGVSGALPQGDFRTGNP